MKVMATYSQVYNVAFISPFESTYFFAYLNYTSSSASVPYYEARQVSSRAAAYNLANGLISPLGCYYQSMIKNLTPLSISSFATETMLSSAVQCEVPSIRCERR